MHSIQIFDQLKWVIFKLKLYSGLLTDSLSGRGNYHVNLYLGPEVNPLNYEDTFVNLATIPRGFGVVVAIA